MTPIKASNVGMSVAVSGILVRIASTDRDPKNYRIVRTARWTRKTYPEPRIGIITGITTKYSGIIHHSDGEDSGYLEVKDSHRCYLVRLGAVNREIVVPPDLLILIGRSPIPMRANAYVWTAVDKKAMSEEAKSQRRDAKGRFLKF
jgi:hypothetical protein